MQHVAIVAHPSPHSISAQIAQAYAAATAKLGQETVVRDLYRIDFEPCLRSWEIPGSKDYTVPADVLRERGLLAEADVYALIYPFWFNAPPAILKGYVDRVFGMGFGYGPGPMGGNAPLLDGKRLISFTTSGAPDAWVKETGALDMLTTGFDRHFAAVCGLRVVDHVNFGGVVPGITKEAVEEMLQTVRATVAGAFDPAASTVA